MGRTPLLSKPAKEKKCRTHLTTQSPAGLFIELLMKFPGARVPARKKNTCFRVVGALGSCTNSCQAPQKKIRRGIPGASCPYHPPRCGFGRPPCHVCGWEIWAVTTAPGQLWTGGSLCCFFGCALPPVAAFFVTWKTPYPPLEPGGLGWAEASGPICEPSLRMI